MTGVLIHGPHVRLVRRALESGGPDHNRTFGAQTPCFYEDDIEPILKSILKVASDYWSQIICSPGISVEKTTPAGQHADVQQGSTSLSAQAEVSKGNADV